MSSPSAHSLGHRIALLLVRLSLGVYLFSAGWGKAFKPDMTLAQSAAAWMEGYQKMTPPWLPTFIATPYGYAIPWLEMLTGGLLVLGLFFRFTTLVTTFMLASIAIAVVADKGSVIHHSIVMTTFAFLLFFTGPGGLSIDALLPRRRRGL